MKVRREARGRSYNVYVGEFGVRPPSAPTTEGVHRSGSLSETELRLIRVERPARTGDAGGLLSFPETFDAVRDLRSFVALVRELSTASENGSRYLVTRSGPASTGRKPTSRISLAATFFALRSSPQYKRLGRRGVLLLLFRLKTSNNTSLGTVLNAETTWAWRTLIANVSAPDDVCATTSAVLFAFIGSEHVTITLPERSPAGFNTALTRDQCTASKSASASRMASRSVPARACPCASRASRISFRWGCANS